jgi:hypothetical protein
MVCTVPAGGIPDQLNQPGDACTGNATCVGGTYCGANTMICTFAPICDVHSHGASETNVWMIVAIITLSVVGLCGIVGISLMVMGYTVKSNAGVVELAPKEITINAKHTAPPTTNQAYLANRSDYSKMSSRQATPTIAYKRANDGADCFAES